MPNPLESERHHSSLVSVADRFIFFIGGGLDSLSPYVIHVEYFDTKTETFHLAPWLNTPRSGHSSCTLGNTIYTFCGQNKDGHLSSVERLRVHPKRIRSSNEIEQLIFPAGTASAAWELVELVGDDFAARAHVLAAPLNGNKIAILGGMSSFNSYLGNGYLFDTVSKRVERVF